MKLDKYIHVFNDAISSDFCDEIIEEYDDPEDWKPGTINDYEVNDYRKCEVVYLSQDEILEKNLKTRKKIDERLFNIITDHLKIYLKNYDSLGYVQIKEDTGYMLLRYQTGDYVKKHVDTSSEQHRTLSCSLILNDNYDGGDFTFFEGEYKISKSACSAIVFPSNFCFPHAITPVTNGDRHVILTWIR